jgi:hypothetical protein
VTKLPCELKMIPYNITRQYSASADAASVWNVIYVSHARHTSVTDSLISRLHPPAIAGLN